jgi:phospholipid/cholesterol/gamma-HCH transport system ATP-binding protein
MSEEKDAAEQRAESADASKFQVPAMKPQLLPTGGGRRAAASRRLDRVMHTFHELPSTAQQAIMASLSNTDRRRYGIAAQAERPSTKDRRERSTPLCLWRSQRGSLRR